jgi:hypothetical protein
MAMATSTLHSSKILIIGHLTKCFLELLEMYLILVNIIVVLSIFIIKGSGMSVQMRLLNNQDVPGPYSLGIENTGQFKITIDGDEITDGGLFTGEGTRSSSHIF